MRIECALLKSELRGVWALKGTTNETPVLGYPPGALRFDNFIGSRQPDGLYHGYYQFTPGGEGPPASWENLHLEPET